MTQHEEALARIVTIVGKLTDDENVSETEKNNIKAEMNRLQEKWNNTQNNVNLNYLRFGFIAFPVPFRSSCTGSFLHYTPSLPYGQAIRSLVTTKCLFAI